MISLCMATRRRPEHYRKLCSSALDLADNPEIVEFVSYHDLDDSTPYDYAGRHIEVLGQRSIGIFTMLNVCQRAATGPIYMFTADDFYFTTKGWDTEVLKVFDAYPDKIVLVCPDGDFWTRWKMGVVGFVHKNFVDALGYLQPPFDGGQASDRWLNELAVAIGRRVRMTSVRVAHTNCKDEIHMEKNKMSRRNGWSPKYWLPSAVEQRKKDIKKLREKCTTPSN